MLALYGTEHFFLLTGGDNAFLLDLRDRGIAPVLARSERSAAFMADAYSRLTRRASFVYGQFGPGAAVALSGLIDAQFAKSAVVGLMSDTKTDVRHRFAYQELDQVAMFAPFTKWAARLERPDRAPDMLRTAIREAVSGCPGPTYLGVPSDMLLAAAGSTDDVYVEDATKTVPAYRTRPDSDAVDAAARLIESADRPVLLAGVGVIVSAAWDAVRALAEAHDIPVVTSVGGKGALPETHRLCHGVAGRYSRRSANAVLQQADVVLAVGTRLGDMTTDRGRAIAPSARVVQVDIDARAGGRNLHPEALLVGDASLALNDLQDALDPSYRCSDWAAEAGAVTAAWLEGRSQVEAQARHAPISPVSVVAALRDNLGASDLVVTDTGYMSAWTSTLYDVRQAGMTHLRTAGSLGWATPASLGAQLAAPRSRVVAVTGDGGIGYHISEIETAVRLGLPVVFVCMNNGGLAFEYQVQEHILGDVEPRLVNFGDADYAAVARGFGARAERVVDPSELGPAMQRALSDGGPVLLEVMTDRDVIAPVTNYDHLQERAL
jgi:acetolactate synthase-1/2/3 large subunit